MIVEEEQEYKLEQNQILKNMGKTFPMYYKSRILFSINPLLVPNFRKLEIQEKIFLLVSEKCGQLKKLEQEKVEDEKLFSSAQKEIGEIISSYYLEKYSWF